MKYLAVLILSVICLTTAKAQTAAVPQSSLFFSAQDAHQADRLAQKSATAGMGDIRLGALMFYAAGDWVLWLQGERWTPATVRDDLHVLEVTPDSVRISWRGEEDQAEHEIRLKPNESYQIATGKIISGL